MTIEAAMQDALDALERQEQEKKQESMDQNVDETPPQAVEAPPPTDPPPPAEDLASQNAALKDQLLRLAADFENFRKRMRREQDDLRRFAVEGVVRDLLPVLDNLERALQHGAENDPLVAGVRMVAKQFVDALATYGVRPFSSVGATFDPERHEAVSQAPAGDVSPGTVLEELVRGYLLHDRLLRPARVVIAQAPLESTADDNDTDDTASGSALE